jgi:predicted nicotinamide N-methyase
VTVLIGDPHRRYLPGDLDLVATYRVRTSHELERSTTTESSVFTIRAAGSG